MHPRPLACDRSRVGTVRVRGRRALRGCVEPLVGQAVEFIRELNAARWRPAAAGLPVASEACFSLEEHLGIVGGRVNRLGDLAPDSDIGREAFNFVRRDLLPVWDAIRNGARAAARFSGLSLDRPLDRLTRCVSPSDFGFHNALLAPDGQVTFLDFEYAGWDDPAKLVCDFFCQPEVPVPERQFESFAGAVAACFPEPELVFARARLLLLVYRVKWVCILLNEFLPVASGRRRFSNGEGLEDSKARQLGRARAMLAAIHDRERVSA